jgi:hypothetical protein
MTVSTYVEQLTTNVIGMQAIAFSLLEVWAGRV